MRALTTIATVHEDGTMTAQAPTDLSRGRHRVVVVFDEATEPEARSRREDDSPSPWSKMADFRARLGRPMTPKITYVEACAEHKLHVRFENGEARLFDVEPYLDKGVFRELRDEAYFQHVRLVWGGVEWPHEQDLSADTLYCAGKPLQAKQELPSESTGDLSSSTGRSLTPSLA